MNPWDDVFGEVPASFEKMVRDTLAGLEEQTNETDRIKQKIRPAWRTVLIAAAAAVLLAGTALAVAISRIQLVKETQTVQYESTGEKREELVLGFKSVDDAPVHLGVWEIGSLPDGYNERVVSDYMIADTGAHGGERWENERGEGIGISYEAADQRFGQIALNTADIAEETDVVVGGSPGTLYRKTNGSQLLLWMNEERGIGFMLNAPADVDILAVAESVRETGEQPQISEYTAAAIDQLGGWTLGDMPTGYCLYFSYGRPGDYAYVYRTYEDAGHYKLHLDYEAAVYTADIDDCAANYRELANMAEMYGNSDEDGVRVEKYTISELEIQGMDARLVKYEDGTPVKLMWMDLEHELVFSLSGDGFGPDELIAMAESVTLPHAAGSES